MGEEEELKGMLFGILIGLVLIIIYLLIQHLIFMFSFRRKNASRGHEEIPQVADLTILNTFEIDPEIRSLWEERMKFFRNICKSTGISMEDFQEAGWINDESIEERLRIKKGLESQINQLEEI